MKAYKKPSLRLIETLPASFLAVSFKEPNTDNVGVNTGEEHDVIDALVNAESFWSSFEWEKEP